MAENAGAQTNALEPKTKLTGKVVKTTLGGAIVDVGQDLPGVIHISQLRKEPVNRVEDAVEVGQEVVVWVRRVKKDRIELTMIEPLPLEWREIKPEMVVKGKIARLESYGAFVEIGAERPGLVHVSEMTHGFIKHPSEVVKVGDEVEVKILEVNRRKKQIRLSMKAVQPEPEDTGKSRRGRGKRSRKSPTDILREVNEEAKEPEPTSMEAAWQAALERAKSRSNGTKAKSSDAPVSEEQEEILARTLEQRVTQ
jgi:ribosomal protein S1